jgi:hypothetical protein
MKTLKNSKLKNRAILAQNSITVLWRNGKVLCPDLELQYQNQFKSLDFFYFTIILLTSVILEDSSTDQISIPKFWFRA